MISFYILLFGFVDLFIRKHHPDKYKEAKKQNKTKNLELFLRTFETELLIFFVSPLSFIMLKKS